MADILIRGMEMPKNCATCRLWTCCEGYKTADYNNPNRHFSCPLIEVPNHGDLISREWLIKNWDKYVYTLTAIEAAPTIIPASKNRRGMNKQGCPPDYNSGFCADYDVDCKACWKQWEQEHKVKENE